MAVIYRQSLTGKAADIKKKALQQAQLDPILNSQIVALNQQRTILGAQQQGLISSVQSSLKDVSNNIYQAQRQARANNAALGYVGGLAQLRNQSELQSQVSYEYSNLINQAEQGAISIAGQQTALNKAEVQILSNQILSETVDDLIKEGRTDIISRDYNKELSYQFQQGITGVLKGLVGGAAVGFGVKKFLNPASGWFAKGATGALALAGLGYTANEIASAAGADTNIGAAVGIPGAIGAIGGIGFGTLASQRKKTILSGLGQTANQAGKVIQETGLGANVFKRYNTTIGDLVNKTATRSASNAFTAGLRGATLSSAQQAKSFARFGLKAGKLVGRLNPWTVGLTVSSALLFGILDGIKARNTKFYNINYDAFTNLDVAQQFEDLGLNLEAVKDIVYNKRD